ncbi:MAG: DUF420 domain-containing protein [Gemmataceae bacterium]
MLTGPNVILALKIAVIAVTLLLIASLIALLRGNYRLHGRINLVFMVLTLAAVLGLETIIRFYDPKMFDYFDEATRQIMAIHLSFSIPSTILLPIMYYTGRTHRRRVHYTLAVVFSICWIGAFITGVGFLPHKAP